MVRPLLRWAGSKKKLLPKLSEYWTGQGCRYVEPFAGSAALFLHLQPRTALLTDINAELVNCLKRFSLHPKRLHDLFQSFPVSREAYDCLRSLDPRNLSLDERAVRFFYLNRYCFNGIYRTNRQGQFNVPYSGDKPGQPPSLAEVIETSAVLRRAEIDCTDFEDVLRNRVHKGDFVYLDPPYATDARRVFREYHEASFGWSDLDRLADAVSLIDSKGAKFVLSYAYCPEALKRFSQWNVQKVYSFRNVSGFASARKRAAEIIATNLFIDTKC